jgi:hypothetical protein
MPELDPLIAAAAIAVALPQVGARAAAATAGLPRPALSLVEVGLAARRAHRLTVPVVGAGLVRLGALAALGARTVGVVSAQTTAGAGAATRPGHGPAVGALEAHDEVRAAGALSAARQAGGATRVHAGRAAVAIG